MQSTSRLFACCLLLLSLLCTLVHSTAATTAASVLPSTAATAPVPSSGATPHGLESTPAAAVVAADSIVSAEQTAIAPTVAKLSANELADSSLNAAAPAPPAPAPVTDMTTGVETKQTEQIESPAPQQQHPQQQQPTNSAALAVTESNTPMAAVTVIPASTPSPSPSPAPVLAAATVPPASVAASTAGATVGAAAGPALMDAASSLWVSLRTQLSDAYAAPSHGSSPFDADVLMAGWSWGAEALLALKQNALDAKDALQATWNRWMPHIEIDWIKTALTRSNSSNNGDDEKQLQQQEQGGEAQTTASTTATSELSVAYSQEQVGALLGLALATVFIRDVLLKCP